MNTTGKKRTRDFFEAAREILGDEKVNQAVQKGKESAAMLKLQYLRKSIGLKQMLVKNKEKK